MSPRPDDMTCDLVSEGLELFVDGDLPSGDAAAMERHLESCAGCRAELEIARAVREGLRSMPMFDAPARVLERVKARAGEGAPDAVRSRWWQLRPSPAWALAAALVLVAILVPVLSLPPTPDPDAVTAADVERAAEEARLALAYVGRYARRTGTEIRDGLIVERLVMPAAQRLSSRADAPERGTQGEQNET